MRVDEARPIPDLAVAQVVKGREAQPVVRTQHRLVLQQRGGVAGEERLQQQPPRRTLDSSMKAMSIAP